MYVYCSNLGCLNYSGTDTLSYCHIHVNTRWVCWAHGEHDLGSCYHWCRRLHCYSDYHLPWYLGDVSADLLWDKEATTKVITVSLRAECERGTEGLCDNSNPSPDTKYLFYPIFYRVCHHAQHEQNSGHDIERSDILHEHLAVYQILFWPIDLRNAHAGGKRGSPTLDGTVWLTQVYGWWAGTADSASEFNAVNDRACYHSSVDIAWWRHGMETLSVLLTHCAWNPPVTVGFPSQPDNNAELRRFLCCGSVGKKKSCCRWFETQWRSCGITAMGRGLRRLRRVSIRACQFRNFVVKIRRLWNYLSSQWDFLYWLDTIRKCQCRDKTVVKSFIDVMELLCLYTSSLHQNSPLDVNEEQRRFKRSLVAICIVTWFSN